MQKSGFFDALLVNGVYDRLYSAADYCDNLAAIIKDGVVYSADDDLHVSEGNGMALSVGIGRAWIKGRYFHNDTVYTALTIGTAPTGTNSRIDRVVLRLDTSVAGRSITLAIKQGTAAAVPTAPALTRSGEIYELCLADVLVVAGATSITTDKITDQRANGSVCGWAASVTPAIMSMLRQYEWVSVLTSTVTAVSFDIPQYDANDVHILEVYTNGILETLGVDYTISGNIISFANSKQAGNEIKVILYKSIDGTGLESVADRVDTLENTVATLDTVAEYVYRCNGVNDNVKLSQIAEEWLTGGSDYGCIHITVVGTFGASAPYGGNGTSASPYQWFRLGTAEKVNRRIFFDFNKCTQINISCPADTYNIIFYGMQVNIRTVDIVATGGAAIYMFSNAGDIVVSAEDCRFWITAPAGFISRGGTFRNCRCSLTLTASDAFCFNVLSAGLLRLIGGEYYAYAPTGSQSAVVYVNSAQTNAVAVTYAINCPAVSRSGYVQSYAINCLTNSALCSFTDTITTLPISAGGQNIRGTIAINKAGLM